jgi:uncharacterized Ntn-hydrolase superfamily protein
MTYSLIARDDATGELGVAVQSRAFRTGAVCAWARAGVGGIATQSFTDVRYGVRGLELLADGVSPADALASLVAEDERADFRQVAFLGADGRAAAHTGSACVPAAGDIAVENASAQGNMLASADVWPAMLDRRLGNPPPGATPEEEMEAARSAGMREDEVIATGAAAAAAAGDVERAIAMLRSLTDADAHWLETFGRYERLCFLPEGVTAQLT